LGTLYPAAEGKEKGKDGNWVGCQYTSFFQFKHGEELRER